MGTTESATSKVAARSSETLANNYQTTWYVHGTISQKAVIFSHRRDVTNGIFSFIIQ
jgi:hypothetical protein